MESTHDMLLLFTVVYTKNMKYIIFVLSLLFSIILNSLYLGKGT